MDVAPEDARGRRASRRRRQSRRRVAALLVAVVVVAVAAGVVLLTGGSELRPVAVRQPAPTTTTTAVNPDAGPFTIATTAVQALAIHADPSGTGAPIATLGPTSEYGLPTTTASKTPLPSVPEISSRR